MDFSTKKNVQTDILEIIKAELAGTSSVKFEVEARLGRIFSRETDTRLYLKSLTPIIFRKLPRKFVFVPGVDKWDVKAMQKNFEGLPQESMKDCFKYLSDGNRIRFVDGRYIYCEKKRKLKVLDIYFPENKYDVRISVMTEEKQVGRMSNSKVNFVRYRERTSYNDGVFNFDFTVVRKEDSPRKEDSSRKEDSPRKEDSLRSGEQTVSYEVEIEVDDPNYSIESFIEKCNLLNISKRM
jgi:mRNA capping enzyme, beta chain